MEWVKQGNDATRRLILKTVGSTFTLTRKKLGVDAEKPFSPVRVSPSFRQQRAVIDDVVGPTLDDPMEALPLAAKLKHVLEMQSSAAQWLSTTFRTGPSTPS